MHYEARRDKILEGYIRNTHKPYVNMLIVELERLREQAIEQSQHVCASYEEGYEAGKDAMAEAMDGF